MQSKNQLRKNRIMCIFSVKYDTKTLSASEEGFSFSLSQDKSLSDFRLRRTENFFYRPVLRYFTVINDGHLIANRLNHAHLVRDNNNGNPHLLIDLFQKFENLLRGFRIECGSSFITEQHLRIRGQGSRNRNSLLLSSGKLGRITLFSSLQTDKFQKLLGSCNSLLFSCTALQNFLEKTALFRNFQGKANVLEKIPLLQKIKLLENHPHVLPHGENFLLLHRA